MKKFVYALVSSAGDYYTEQAVMSMYSLRLHNPSCHITLVADEDTLESLTGKRSRIKEYADELVSVNPPSDFTPVQKSRFIKTTLRQNVRGDFMYLDNDTIVNASLEDLDAQEYEMGAVLDCHSTYEHNGQLRKYLAGTGQRAWDYNRYFNGGVWVARDTERVCGFFRDWHRLWNEDREKYGISIDQPSFARANIANGCFISEISGVYNCQITIPGSRKYLLGARVLHYFAEVDFYYPLKDRGVFESVRENGICGEVKYMIENPVLSWLEKVRIIGGEELRIYDSPMVVLGRKLSRDCVWTNKVAQLLYRLFGFTI